MPNFYEMFETPKIHWPITFVVDTSGSMAGQRLVQLNSALHELSNILESLAYQGDIQLSIRLIEFNTTMGAWRCRKVRGSFRCTLLRSIGVN